MAAGVAGSLSPVEGQLGVSGEMLAGAKGKGRGGATEFAQGRKGAALDSQSLPPRQTLVSFPPPPPSLPEVGVGGWLELRGSLLALLHKG